MTSFTFWGDGDLEPDKDPMSTPDDDSQEFEFQSSSHESGELILSDLKILINNERRLQVKRRWKSYLSESRSALIESWSESIRDDNPDELGVISIFDDAIRVFAEYCRAFCVGGFGWYITSLNYFNYQMSFVPHNLWVAWIRLNENLAFTVIILLMSLK